MVKASDPNSTVEAALLEDRTPLVFEGLQIDSRRAANNSRTRKRWACILKFTSHG